MSEPTSALIRRPLLRGRQYVAGLWFPAERFSAAERIGCMLAYWEAGCQAHRFDDGDLLQFANARQLDCERLSAWPLLRVGSNLCSAVLEDHERGALAPADVWLVRGGQVAARHLAQAIPLELQAWLHIDDYSLLDTYDCSEVVPAPIHEPAPTLRDIRDALGDAVAPASPARDEMLRALRLRRQGLTRKALAVNQPGSSIGKVIAYLAFYSLVMVVTTFTLIHLIRTGPVPDTSPLVMAQQGGTKVATTPVTGDPGVSGMKSPAVSGLLPGSMIAMGAIGLTLVLVICWLIRRGGTPEAAGWTSARPSRRRAMEAAPATRLQPRASPVTLQAWRSRLASLATLTRLNKALGWRQAVYMRRVLAMFEKGDIEEALRHAIPLGGDLGSLGQSFGTPRPRGSLRVGQPRGAAASMDFGGDFERYLRTVYRRHFEKLDGAGRVDEAVFVLAELLNARQEALDYLEKHQRFQQAAALALFWDSSPATIVRLHCLADDWQRALQVARRDNAFADAIPMLQDKWPDVANRLRLEWAEMLGARGEWLEAVEAIWSLTQERERACHWLRQAESAGGTLSGRALVKRALLLPDTLQAYADYLTRLRDDPQCYPERAALIHGLCTVYKQTQKKSQDQLEAFARLARVVIGPALEDHASLRAPLENHQLQNLIALSRDPLLQADLPKKLSSKPLMSLADRRETAQWYAPEAGRQAILDAVPLHDDRSLLALGEGGALIVGRDGNSLFRFAVPAYRIVIAHSGLTALALARRDQVWRVSKLDLVSRTVRDLGVLVLDFHEQMFDGTHWVIASGNQIRVVDVDKAFASTWHVSDLPGPVLGYKRMKQKELWLIGAGKDALELWTYVLPQRRLASRTPLTPGDQPLLFGPSGQLIEIELKEDGTGALSLQLGRADHCAGVLPLPALDLQQRSQLEVRFEHGWVLLGVPQADRAMQWQFFSGDRVGGAPRACLNWPSWTNGTLRIVDEQLVAFDAEGRLFRVDLGTCRTLSLALL
ncbi:MAG: bpX6 domain-containing protein [Pseudomonas sp.]|uniref:bpX6 domain-containing protein n=1 Tax=Pseudomonas sp. TaxID=306 RepID=UPI003391F963